MDSDLKRLVEALLFAAPEPLSLERIKSIIPRSDKRTLRATIAELVAEYDEQEHAFQLVEIGGGWRITTRSEYSRLIEEMLKGQRKVRLSKPALEVLSVVSYRQPCTRVDVEDVRGVNCGGSLATLLERGMVRITGRAETLGRPLLYGTTDEFLSYMGINSIEDLPNLTEIEALLAVPRDERVEDTPIAAEERRLRLVEGMESISEIMGVDDAPEQSDMPEDSGTIEAAADSVADPAEEPAAVAVAETAESETAEPGEAPGVDETPATIETTEITGEQSVTEDEEHIRLLQESLEEEVATLVAAEDVVGELTSGNMTDSVAQVQSGEDIDIDAGTEGTESATAIAEEASA
ncbi:MAG: SMC-Scp complex subunit ScpB [bacterium]|nr:SMC-Scp complex subunit ScpB [bacterium]